ncbi:hypothetical protein HDU96_001725 [Phlyctochytrium bullatum]|nr:hypothetical protein HDU96_001725 [Phlyctochytrium bullatum]
MPSKTVVKYLGIPQLANTTLDYSSFDIAVNSLKKDNITLVVDLAATLSTTDYVGLLGSLLKTNSSEYDIYAIDVVWPGQYADNFLDISSYVPESVKAQHIQNIYNANNIGGRQVALPFFADYGVMFYRADLLQKYNFSGPPRTWDEMEQMMSVIVPAERRSNPSFFGYAGQYNSYEGLTCNFLEWIFSVGGGTIIEPNKTVSVNSPAAAKMITRMKSWLNPPKTYTPLTGLIFDETASYQQWLKGNLLFMRNWPFVFSITNNDPNFPKFPNGSAAFGMTRLPGETPGQSAATLGGWQLAINKFTKNPEAAVKAALALMTREFQMGRFRTIGIMPTIADLYNDPEFCRLNPNCKVFGSLQVAARPSAGTAPYYLAASEQIYLTANKILRDELTVEDGLKQMVVNIQKAIRTYVEPSIDLGPPVSALVTKNYRIFKIFRNKHLMKLKLNDAELIKTCAALLIVDLILLIVWTAVDPPQKALVQLTTSQFFTCRSNNGAFAWGIIGCLLGYNSLLLGAGVYLAYYTRNVKGPYNESKFIGYTIYTMVLLNVILVG